MLDPESLLGGISVIGALTIIGLIVFAESGLLIGLFLPGDTLLFTAGFFAAHGDLPLFWVIAVIFAAAIIGDNVGYYIGQKTGPRIFIQREGLFFRKEYVGRAQAFYARHGGQTILLARFIPYIRTLAPIVAGIANMNRAKFIVYNILSALLWTITFVLLGYWLGVELSEQIERYIIPTLILGLLFTFSPTLLYFARNLRWYTGLVARVKKRGRKSP